jgi:peptidoglycan/LPS O-acetylase OafA/YrhL
VLAYHLGISWIPGGFLGVDLFFVISGYVITRLILDSINTASALDLRAFYRARLRRLYPALILLIIGTPLLILAFAPDGVHRFVQDLPYVLTGTNNWHLVALHQDYFQINGRPPLLQHTWSLAVEIQFYIVWPVILYFIWKRFGKRNIAPIALLIAIGSGVALFLNSLRLDHASASRISHVYFGTDTHSLGLFIGSALAVSWIPANLSTAISQRAQDFVDGIGLVGIFGIIASFLYISESNATLYRIAFPLAALFGCMTIISLVHPASRLARIFSTRPLLWIGQRSYGIYLWHWVIFQMTRPSIDLAASSLLALNIARFLLVLVAADISLRYFELPFRRGVIESWLRGIKYRSRALAKRQRIFVGVVASFALLIPIGASFGSEIRAASIKYVYHQDFTTQQNKPLANDKGLWVIGDSIILGSRYKLDARSHIALINARVGRQIQELTDVARAEEPQMANSTTVLDLGNNNHLTSESVVTLLDILKSQPKVVLVNTSVPRAWRDDNNRIITEVAGKYSNVKIVDWSSISTNHPEFFGPDGVHLSDQGSDVYVSAIMDALAPTK